MTIGKKIASGFATLLLLGVTTGLFSVYEMNVSVNQTETISDSIEKVLIPTIETSASLEASIFEANVEARAFGLSLDDHYKQSFAQKWNKVERYLEQGKQIGRENPNEAGFNQMIDSVSQEADEFIELMRQTKTLADISHQKREIMDRAASQSISSISQFYDAQMKRLEEEISKGSSSEVLLEREKKIDAAYLIRNAMNRVRIAAFKSIADRNPQFIREAQGSFADISEAVASIRPITRMPDDIAALDLMEKSAQQYEKATKEIADIFNKLDSIGAQRASKAQHLAESAAHAITEGLKKEHTDVLATTQKIQKASTVNLAAVIFMSVTGLILTVFITRAITKPLNLMIERLKSGADQTNNTVNRINEASQSLAEAASEQAASLEETSASLEEMSSMTQRNNDSAQEARQMANQTRQSAETGVADMDEMVKAVDAIKQSSDDISKIIKTIDDIAFQTNILALNAAVEAARAGEAGAGFAVVADEVRSLAQRSANAAKETAEKISEAIANSTQGVEISGRVSESLNTMLSKAEDMDGIVSQISDASAEQSQGIGQVNIAVSQMDQVTQKNAATSEETAAAAQELSGQASQLKGAVDELMTMVGGQGSTITNPLASNSFRKQSGGAQGSFQSIANNTDQPSMDFFEEQTNDKREMVFHN